MYIIIVVAILAFIFFNWLMGYRKGNIILDLDDRYMDKNDYVKAIKDELEKQGRTVTYPSYNQFIIDDKPYTLVERNVPMGGVPLQRTILKPDKKN